MRPAILLLAAAVVAACASRGPPSGNAPPIAAIGRKMFFDSSLSASGKLACATCHDPRYAYGPPPGRAIALGGWRMDQSGTRAVPSLRYKEYTPGYADLADNPDGVSPPGPGGGLMQDGRAETLAAQASMPLLSANEMANKSAKDIPM